MQNSNALSPEVRDLFETVRQQARKYTEAFDYFELEKKELIRRKDEFISTKEDFRDSISQSIDELKSQISDSLRIINDKTNESLIIFNDMDNIKKFKDSLNNLNNSIQGRIWELDKALADFKIKSDNELQNELVNIRGNVEKELESLAQKIEVRVTISMKKLEGRLLNYDQKLFALNDNQQRSFNRINEEVDKLKEDILMSKSSNTEFKQEVFRKLDEFDIDMKAQLQSFKMKSEDELAGQNDMDPDNYVDKDHYRHENDNLMTIYNKLADKVDLMKKRETIWIYLTVLSLICILILFFFVIR